MMFVYLLDILYSYWVVSEYKQKKYTIRDTLSLGGYAMPLKAIGRNIRTYRKAQRMSIEALAYQANLSKNYLALIERGEKIPSLETFLIIVNALRVSSDQILCDVVSTGFAVRSTILTDRIEKATPARRKLIYNVIDTLLQEDE